MMTIKEFLNDWIKKTIDYNGIPSTKKDYVMKIEDIENANPLIAKHIRDKFTVEGMCADKYNFMLVSVGDISSETPSFTVMADTMSWEPNTFMFNTVEWKI